MLAGRLYSSFRDPYAVLGLGPSASNSDIKKAYFDLVKKYHPDTNKDPEASTKFIEIQNAYEILSDPERKSMYDQYGTTEEASQQPGDRSDGGAYDAGGAGFDPSDLFRNIFRGAGFGRGFDHFGSSRSSRPNLDVNATAHLTFLEAAKGTTKSFTFSRMEQCAPCGGKGVAKGSTMITCRRCRGSGEETHSRAGFILSTPCRACDGTGRVNPDPCSSCGGSGAMRRGVSVEVQIPPGAAEGDIVLVTGEGSRIGGRRGNLNLQIDVDTSDVFTRKKDDIYVTIAVDLLHALTGGTLVVPTIHGNVEMKLPPGVQSDDVKKLAGRGVYNASTKNQGHQFVRLKVEIPRDLSEAQIEAIARALGKNPPHPSSSANESASKKQSNTDTTFSRWLHKLRSLFQ